ncbi:MAG: endonuclease/exonuclease/phosphatase family protein [Steroidobacteraceae bacterium]
MTRAGLALVLLALAAPTATAADAERLSIATWNLEWMMTPATFDALAANCLGSGHRAGGRERAIPCNLAPHGRWSAEELARLRAFAATLPLDVIALQETDGPEAAAQLFPGRAFCFTRRKHVQNVGFAIRRGIPFRCNDDYRALGLEDDDVRWGADLTLFPGTRRELRLLSVHLKSGCNRDPLTADRPDCQVLRQQVPVLEQWIDRRARAGSAFAVIGDFNRRFDRESKQPRDASGRIAAMWPEIDDGDPADADLVNAGSDYGPVGCANGHGKRVPIDHFVLGRRLARQLVAGSFRVWDYPSGKRWPDHCLVSIELELEARHGL